MSKASLVVLISGRGSNMIAIANACASGELNAQISLVISNEKNAAGIDAAKKLGIDTCVIEHTAYPNREAFDSALAQRVALANPDWIALAGFMRILGEEFVATWPGKILNIHPSLLPLYPGLNTHQRALDAGDKVAGATVHIVTGTLDDGPIFAQVKVPIFAQDTAQSLAQRVIKEEHALYVYVLKHCTTKTSIQDNYT